MEEHTDEELYDLIRLVKKTIHPQYKLAQVLERKIAFHYGHMPIIIRKEIERLYSKGKIKYLICTSTLLEGVNLPAKSIFIRKPKRGKRGKAQMSDSDFWNLAGRAGRLKKEFQGNIICIDPEKWDRPPIRKRSKFVIERAISGISKDKHGLLEYIKNDTPKGLANDKFEHAFSYYFNKFLKQGNLKSEILDIDFISDLEKECNRIKNQIEIPEEILFRNPGISPLAQQSLLEYFKTYKKDIENLIPGLPNEEDAAQKYYVQLVNRISKTLSPDTSALAFPRAILIVSWMKGFPLARIINANLKYWNGKKPLATVIRDTMGEIEDYVRYRFAKYSGCYVDILRFYLRTKKPELVEKIPDINIWIEFGVSLKTQISLINLGFSRHTAIEISEKMEDKDLKTIDAANWIIENSSILLDSTETAEAVKIEIRSVLTVVSARFKKDNKG